MISAPSPSACGRAFWRDRWIRVSLAVFVAVRLLYFAQVSASLPLLGDEGFYYHHASTVGSLTGALLHGDVAGAAARAQELIDRGWYLPGMSVVLAPVRAVTDRLALARLYVGIVNSLICWLAVRRLAAWHGLIAARVAAGVLAVLPVHAAFSFTFWGDLLAGHGVVLLLLAMTPLQRDQAGDASLRRARLAAVGAGLLALVYLRPSLLLLLPATGLWLLLFTAARAPLARALRTSAAGTALVAAVVAAGLAPWSYAVSTTIGGFFVTTTSVDLNIVEVFGADTWKGDLPPGDNLWVFLFERAEREAAASGRTVGALVNAQRDAVLRRLTWPAYAAAVRENLRRFFLTPSEFLERFASRNFAAHGKDAAFSAFNRVAIALNAVLWFAVLAGAIGVLLLPWRLSGAGWWLGALFRVTFCAMAVQPYVSHASGRYYAMLTPLLAATLGVAAARITAPSPQGVDDGVQSGAFRVIEWAMPAVILVAVVVLWLPVP